jgi:ribonuclease T2
MKSGASAGARLARILAVLLLAGSGAAGADQPGQFDYYVLSLSWSLQYCASGSHDDQAQCTRPYAFVAHGLWPQNERGYPRGCYSHERVSDGTIDQMLPIMPSRGLVIHEWHTHGACSGLGADDYFATVERAYRSIKVPPKYQSPQGYVSVGVDQLKDDFAAANPGLRPADMAVQCSGHYLQEVRVCLTRDLNDRACSADVRDRCDGDAVLRPVR